MTPTQSISRRRLLALAAASAAPLWMPRSAWSNVRPASTPFQLGIASGSPTHDSLVLWTRLVLSQVPEGMQAAPGQAPTVHWEMAHDANFKKPVQSGQAHALPELAHSVHVEVLGLLPDRWYFYRFRCGDVFSETGRTRTFPLPGAAPSALRVAYASCQNWQHGYFGAYRHMLADAPDAVLFLGDYIYEYPNSSKPVRKVTGGWVLSLDDYRQRYALYKSDGDLQAMHEACPWLVTWDDHEVQNDYAGLQEGRSGAPEPNFAMRRAAAYQAFYEHMPIRAAVLTKAIAGLGQGAEMRIYQRVDFGQLASFYMLDARQYKDPQVCTKNNAKGSSFLDPAGCDDWNDGSRTLLGAAQEQWLNAQLARSGRQWNVIGQQTLLGQRDFRAGPGRLLWNDGWDGYSAARGRLTGALQKHGVANPVVLGGDVHENWVGHIKADYQIPSSAALGVEFCGTSISSHSGGNEKTGERLAENPHFVFADAKRKGYGLLHFRPDSLTCQLRVVDDERLSATKVETLASFHVQAGRPVVEQI